MKTVQIEKSMTSIRPRGSWIVPSTGRRIELYASLHAKSDLSGGVGRIGFELLQAEYSGYLSAIGDC